MRYRIIFFVIGVAVIGLAISGLLVILQLLSNKNPSATITPAPSISGVQTSIPASPIEITSGISAQGTPNRSTIPSSGKTVSAGLPTNLPADVCPVCQGLRTLGSGFCPICSGSGKLISGLKIDPSIFPQGGLGPNIPLFEIKGADNTSLLRSVVTSSYDGSAWHLDPNEKSFPYTGDSITSTVNLYSQKISDEISVTTLQKLPETNMVLPTSLYPVSLTSALPSDYYPAEQQFVSPRGLPGSYSFKAVHYAYSDEQLSKAQIDPDIKYLQAPSSVPERVKNLAGSITNKSQSPYQKARAIEEYLESNYQYDLDYQPAPAGREANDWFLFDEKKGVCTNFNSAFVLLARSAGIPARLVDGYKIDPGAGDQTVYASQAHAWSEVKLKDLGWVTFDATGKSAGALITQTDISAVSSPILKGKTFQVQGTVTNAGSEPVDGVPVELFLNTRKATSGGIPVGNGSVKNGLFDITATVSNQTEVGQYQLMAHCQGGTKYKDSWSDPAVTVITGTILDLMAPSSIRISEQLMLKGTLTEDSHKPLTGQKVDIFLGDILITSLTTDENGQFLMWQSFSNAGEYTLKAVFPGSDYYLQSQAHIDFQVLTPTRLRLKAPSKANIKQAFTIEGSLAEEMSGLAFPNQKIDIVIDNVLLKEKPVTNAAGIFLVKSILDEEGSHTIEARYAGVPYYSESAAEASIEIIPAPVQAQSSPIWLFPVIVLAVIAMAVGVFFLLRRRKPKAQAVEPLTAEDIPEIAIEPVTEEPEAEVDISTDEIILSIEFPEIEAPLPDVWGEGEELKVVCFLRKADSTPLSSKQLEFLIGKNTNRVSTDASGAGLVQCTFKKKGQYQLAARYLGETGSEPLVAKRIIRIVDYREEIVDLFKSILEWLRRKGLDLPPKATPREIKQALSESNRVISAEALDNIIVCFEEADYSLHTIQRNNYETMYLAQKEIRDHEPTPPAAA